MKYTIMIQWSDESPRKNQICTELDNGVILIKESITDEPIGIEILSYQ